VVVGSPKTVREQLMDGVKRLRMGHLLALLHFGSMPTEPQHRPVRARGPAASRWAVGWQIRGSLVAGAPPGQASGCRHGGCVLIAGDSDLGLLGNHIKRAGFATRLMAEHSILIESFLLYELTIQSASSMPFTRVPVANDWRHDQRFGTATTNS